MIHSIMCYASPSFERLGLDSRP